MVKQFRIKDKRYKIVEFVSLYCKFVKRELENIFTCLKVSPTKSHFDWRYSFSLGLKPKLKSQSFILFVEYFLLNLNNGFVKIM